jgi:hypothetical protein
MMILTTTAFAEEESAATPAVEPAEDAPYVYTSEDFKYTITCPIKPLAVIQNPWQEPERRGEMLVFAYEGFDILYAYKIQVNAFDTNQVPDFNKGSIAAIGDYLTALKNEGGYSTADLVNITKNNKGVTAVTADKIEVINKETGEVEGELVADRQFVYTYFRSPEGRCIGIQLISANLSKQYIDTYRYSVASFKDNTSAKDLKKDKKSKDKDKKAKDKKDKSKDKKSKDKAKDKDKK